MGDTAISNIGANDAWALSVRRQRLVASLRAEGASDATIERLTGDETVRRMLDHERQCAALIANLFGGART